jgi:molybdopterin-guanine dinucleotide biosynthesis protein
MLLTGGLATGKTVVVKEVVAIASTLGLRAAAIDVDWLGWATGATLELDDRLSP